MATYQYKAKQGPKRAVTGLLEAENRGDALEKLSRQGFYPLHIEEFQEPTQGLRSLLNSVSRKDVAFVTRQMADLLESNVSLLRALELTQKQTRNPSLKRILQAIIAHIEGGKSFSEALRMFPREFSPLYVNLVHAGEVGEMLPLTLSRLAAFMEQEEDFRSRLLAALAYPLFILAVGGMTIVFLMLFVVPRLTAMFIDSGEGLPWIARSLSALSEVLSSGRGMLAISAFAGGIAWVIWRMPRQAKEFFDQAAFRLPLWGTVLKKGMLARFTRTLSMLLAGGVPILQALRVVSHVLDHPLFREHVQKVSYEVEQGAAFSECLKRSQLFPDFVCQMLAVGEEANTLEKSLDKIAATYERETDRAMKLATSLLEPIMILAVGSVIGIIVIGMLLPIFQISTFVK